MKEILVDADRKHLPAVQALIDTQLAQAGCPPQVQIAIDVAVEEIFINIASYAYAPGTGKARVQIEVHEAPPSAEIRFLDRGQPYNPLAAPEPDIFLPLRQRRRGGLGVYMVKQSMDQVEYEYRDGQNVFTIKKVLFPA